MNMSDAPVESIESNQSSINLPQNTNDGSVEKQIQSNFSENNNELNGAPLNSDNSDLQNSSTLVSEENNSKILEKNGLDSSVSESQDSEIQLSQVSTLSLPETNLISEEPISSISLSEPCSELIPNNDEIEPASVSSETYKINENTKDDDMIENNSEMNTFNNDSQNSMDTSTNEIDFPENNCYCGKKRDLNTVELQCAGCYKWFHQSCVEIDIGKCLPFMTYYTFSCKSCSPTNTETFFKKQPNFSQMCATALANLTQQSLAEGQFRTVFSKDKEIIPFIESHWESLTPMQRRIKQTWHATVSKVMMKDNDLFMCNENRDAFQDGDQPLFGLSNQNLFKISPCYESTIRGFQKQSQDFAQTVSAFSSGKGRGTKRRFIGDGQTAGSGKRIKSDLVMPKLPPNGYPLEHPFNKDGYRYILAEPDPHAPFRQEFDESQDWAGKPIPPWLYRKLTPNNVLIALHDRAPQLKISEDRLTATGEKGYSMTRATHGLSRGTWFYEINIDEMNDNSATRLGWSQSLANLQAPLGYDKFSYSWRSRKGTKFHESRGYHYCDQGYGQGDVIGCLIHLPDITDEISLPPIFKDKPLVKFKSYLYYEEKDEPQLELKRLAPLPGSKIVFYKNGQLQGTAFENIYGGTYFPAASLYKNCTVTFNFGPNFKFPPKDVKFRGVYEAAEEAIVEQTMTDLLFFTENKGKLRLDL